MNYTITKKGEKVIGNSERAIIKSDKAQIKVALYRAKTDNKYYEAKIWITYPDGTKKVEYAGAVHVQQCREAAVALATNNA